MPLATQLFALFLVATVTSASPVNLPKKSLTLNQSLRPNDPSHDVIPNRGIEAYARALAKYGASPEQVTHLQMLALQHGSSPSSRAETVKRKARESSARRGIPSAITNAVLEPVSVASEAPVPTPKVAGPLNTIPDIYDGQFLTQVQIGDRVFWVDFDTGSSDFWVYGDGATGLDQNQTAWHQTTTSTELKGETFYITYGDGSVASGDVWKDRLMIGSVVVPNATIEVATDAAGTFSPPLSGIVGLGFDSGNQAYPTQQKTIFTNLIESGLISEPVLSADLKHAAPGCYTFGEIPSWQYSGAITYAKTDSSDSYWMFSPLGYAIGSDSTNSSAAALGSLRGVVDTGSSLMVLEDSIAVDYWSRVPSAYFDPFIFGGYAFDCNEVLPDFKLVVGEAGDSYTIIVPGEYINYASFNSSTCFGGLQSNLDQIPFSIWGDVLIKSTFIVFDRGSNGHGPRMGFADKGPY